jgi:hypothetical protein
MQPYETIKIGRHVIKIYQDEDPLNPRTEWDNVGTMACWHRDYNLGDEQPKIDPEQYLLDLAVEVNPEVQVEIDRYEYPDEYDDEVEAKAWEEIQNLIQFTLTEHYIILPLFLYDHSGITMRTGPFGDPWDSGQVGVIHVSKDKAWAEWGSGFVKYLGVDTPGLTRNSYYHPFQEKDGQIGIRDHFGKPVVLGPGEYQQVKDEIVWADRLDGEVKVYDQYLTNDIWGYVVETENGVEVDSCWGFFGLEYAIEEATSVAEEMEKEATVTFDFTFRLRGTGVTEAAARQDAIAAFCEEPGEPESSEEVEE